MDVPKEHDDLAPVFAVGEAKQHITGSGASEAQQARRSFTAQMAAAIYPTLAMLSMIHMRSRRNTINKQLQQLPKEYIIYGIYYDEREVRIYAHFPLYRRGSWRFVQALVGILPIPGRNDMKMDALLSLSLASAAMTVRAQVQILSRFFGENDKKVWQDIVSDLPENE